MGHDSENGPFQRDSAILVLVTLKLSKWNTEKNMCIWSLLVQGEVFITFCPKVRFYFLCSNRIKENQSLKYKENQRTQSKVEAFFYYHNKIKKLFF